MKIITNKEEQKYLDLMNEIVSYGESREDRTGVGTKSIFGTSLRFSLKDNTLPLLTTKKTFLKGIVEELLFFIRGWTDTKSLEDKGVRIWQGNTSREFLDNRGLTYLKEGDMGKGYGFQWRKFGESDCECSMFGIDQLAQVVSDIKTDPFSRRHIITAWNPQQLKECALPPCHMLFQFYVSNDGGLSCQFNMRSTDYFLGLPYNIASYSILTHIIAQLTGLKAKEVIFVGGDTHIYSSHIEQANEQIKREPYAFPKIKINKELKTLEDVEALEFSDFELIDYKCHTAIKAEMSV